MQVSVAFFDTRKLASALALVAKLSAVGHLGYSPRQWGAVDENGALISPPVAGWNLCHKTDREQGERTTAPPVHTPRHTQACTRARMHAQTHACTNRHTLTHTIKTRQDGKHTRTGERKGARASC